MQWLLFLLCGAAHANSLFTQYPAIAQKMPYVSLGDFPTPIIFCSSIHAQFPYVNLYIKHDGMTGLVDVRGHRAYGGNKLRKLQYLLADAQKNNCDAVITFGCAGSNHALQTTVCAHKLGLASYCVLRPQINTQIVCKNLLLQLAFGAHLYAANGRGNLHDVITACACLEHAIITGKFPYKIPVGGSNALGAVGYVEAAFELKEQIDQGLIPKPDRIYLALGSGGTVCGLLLGLKAAGIQTKVYAVLVEPISDLSHKIARIENLYRAIYEKLHTYDPDFPCCILEPTDYEIISDFAGDRYGALTKEGCQARELLFEEEGITLDDVYTSKCFSAVLHDLRSGSCDGQTILFWNTFCGETFEYLTHRMNYHDLPHEFHTYFEEPIQVLDR